MPRFYLPSPLVDEGLLRVEGPEVKHIRRVLRLRVGDRLTVFGGDARQYEGRIIEESPSAVVMKVERIFSPQTESPLHLTLAQSLLKGEKMDYLIQKATELGVNKIIPFFSSRSIPVLDPSRRWKRCQRWERIAIEACKQCGRMTVPEVKPPQSYAEVLEMASPGALRLILWEKEGRGLKEVLRRPEGSREVFFLVGPEGGLTEAEVEEAKRVGFISIHLGRRILKSETASLCVLSILQYEWGDLGHSE